MKTIEQMLVREQLKVQYVTHPQAYPDITLSRSNTTKTRLSFFTRPQFTLGQGRTYTVGHNECAYFVHYDIDRPSLVRVVLGEQLNEPLSLCELKKVIES
jgi:hypothetical protein